MLPTSETLWVGAGDGLYRLNGNRLERAFGSELQGSVFALLEDSIGRLWAGTDDGVYRWDGRRLGRLGLRHGLMGREANRSGLIEDRHGRVWVGTQLGLSRFDPAFERSLEPPRAEVVSIEVGSESYPPESRLRLPLGRYDPAFVVRVASLIDEALSRWAPSGDQKL